MIEHQNSLAAVLSIIETELPLHQTDVVFGDADPEATRALGANYAVVSVLAAAPGLRLENGYTYWRDVFIVQVRTREAVTPVDAFDRYATLVEALDAYTYREKRTGINRTLEVVASESMLATAAVGATITVEAHGGT